jgi:predicted GIY-YIG superfamily endonuclease
MDKDYCVYILASQRNGSLYSGITSNLLKGYGDNKNKEL